MSEIKPFRQLDPAAAFAMGVVGLGFLYVGRFRLMLWILLSAVAIVLLLSWTRWVLQPAGSYVLFGTIILALILRLVLPTYIAWRDKSAPVKFYNRWYFYVGWLIAVSLFGEFVVFPLRYRVLGYAVYRVPSESMAPTLDRGDFFTVDTWRYDEHRPRVGELAVFDTTDGYTLVKRIVGVPDDRIEIRNGRLHRNGSPVAEPYLHRNLEVERSGREVPAIELGAGEYYVLGDFRDMSRDSRVFGPISEEQLIGRAEYSVLSRRRLAPPAR